MIQDRAISSDQVLRAPACLRDDRLRVLVARARAQQVIDLRRPPPSSEWAARVRTAQAASA